MYWKDKTEIHNKNTQFETKEVVTNVEFSTGDLIHFKNALESTLGNKNIQHSTKEWIRCTLEDINSSLNKV